jgi:hypothetical protein
MVKLGVAIEKNESGKVPHEGMNYPYPIFVSTAQASDDLAYGLTKAVMENYDEIKDAGPGMSGYQLKNQNLKWIFPYHPGAIKFYKEKGVWTAEHDKHNDGLLKRQDVLAAAWKEHVAANGEKSDEEFEKAWQGLRAAALEKAGMGVPFKTW